MTTSAPPPACQRCRGKGYINSFYAGCAPRRCRCNPAPKPHRGAKAATHRGECGVCGQTFTVGRTDEHLALHGFARPGTGWIVGECPGHGHQPVELSPETLHILRDIARNRAEVEETALAHFRSGTVEELRYEIRRPGLPRTASHAERFEAVLVRRGDRYDSVRGVPSFEDLLERRIQAAEMTAKHARNVEQATEAKIAAWTARPLRAI